MMRRDLAAYVLSADTFCLVKSDKNGKYKQTTFSASANNQSSSRKASLQRHQGY